MRERFRKGWANNNFHNTKTHRYWKSNFIFTATIVTESYQSKYIYVLLYCNNSIQLFIIYVLSQQPEGQLQTQHSVDTSSYIIDKHKLQASTGWRK
jgi:predicted transglutaminase-like protease